MVTSGFFRGPRMNPDEEIPNLTGQVYIVTGASKGIGYGIVTHLLKHNAARIIALSSSASSAEVAHDSLERYGDNSRLVWVPCDFRDLRQVDVVAKKLREEESRLDSLILNAGIGVGKYSLSQDKIDSHFQINALAQLHLALMLLPKLRETSALANRPSRLVMMSSEMHRFAPLGTKFDSLEELNHDVGAVRLYSRSKLAQILLIHTIADGINNGRFGFTRVKDTDASHKAVLVNATHPGGVDSAQPDQLITAWGWFGRVVVWFVRPLMVSPIDHGCLSALAASTPTKSLLEGTGWHGQYILPDKKVGKPSGKARDEAMRERLWKLSIELLQDRIGTLDYGYDIQA